MFLCLGWQMWKNWSALVLSMVFSWCCEGRCFNSETASYSLSLDKPSIMCQFIYSGNTFFFLLFLLGFFFFFLREFHLNFQKSFLSASQRASGFHGVFCCCFRKYVSSLTLFFRNPSWKKWDKLAFLLSWSWEFLFCKKWYLTWIVVEYKMSFIEKGNFHMLVPFLNGPKWLGLPKATSQELLRGWQGL